ncbi:MAG TPA: calcium-binding protein [Isosphaeraceae bacterium]|nr:calcium-binding protein [Isosphaeraceae bacterium]
MLTIDFAPHFGAEATNFGGGEKLSNVPVYLIFWGSSWVNNQKTTDIENAAAALYNSPYLSGLKQYGSDGHAFYAGAVINTSDPANGFSDGDITNVVDNAIDNQGLPESDAGPNKPIYFVVTPPGVSSNDPNAGAYHSTEHDYDFPFDLDEIPYGWIGGGGGSGPVDTYTYFLSHETAEAMSDTSGDGITITHGATWPGGGDNEIGDAEAQNYTYRLNGIRVQSFWSAADKAYIVPDGNSQTFVYTPNYSGNSYLGTGSLTVNGDQLGPNYNDNVNVTLANDGGVQVTLNGETVHFAPGAITSISVNTGGGNDTVNVEKTAFNVPVSINTGGGSDTVNIAPTDKNLNDIQGQVGVVGNSVNLNINDSLNSFGSTYSLSSANVSRPGAASIGFSGVTSLNLDGGSGNDTYNVESTASATSTTLFGGDGNDTFNLSPSAHNLSNVAGPVNLYGGGGNDSIVVNDQANASAATYSVSLTSISRPGAGTIGYSGDENVLIDGGSASDTYNIESTASGTTTTIEGGAGNDTFNVTPTSKNLANIQGPLNLYGLGGTDTVNLHDESNAAATTYSVGSSSVSRPGAATIGYSTDENLNLDGGGAGDVYNVESTPAGTTVTLVGGAGNDAFNVAPTSKNLGNIQGPLNLYGEGGTDSVALHDESNAGGAAYSVSSSSVTRSGAATIGYSLDEKLSLAAGSGNDTLTVASTSPTTPVSFNGGAGTDTLVGPNVASTWNLVGAGGGNVGNVTFAAVENLTGGSANDTFKFAAGATVAGKINGGGGVNALDYSSYTTGVTVNLTTGTATGTGGVLNIQNVTGSPGNDHITGNAANNVIVGDGGTDVLVGGGGNDTFVLAATQGAATTVTGGVGVETLIGANINNVWTLTGTNAGNVNGIAFTGINTLVGGSLADTFRFAAGSVTGKINGGAGSNKLDYSLDGGVAATVNLATGAATKTGGFLNIQALTGGSAADTLVGLNVAQTWSITGLNTGTVGAFAFAGVENLTGGSSVDVFQFGPSGSVAGKVDGGAGLNRLDYSADGGVAATVNLATGTATKTGGFLNIQALTGSSAASDKLVGANVAQTWSITGLNAGTVGAFAFTGVENLTGGTNVDIFKFSNGAGVTGKIDGGVGGAGDWLDFSASTTALTVNLATGVASHTGGVANVRNVIGGSGVDTLTGNSLGNVLVGGTANDVITGGSGRSILIGGKGSDKVTGGSSDDIVIGDSTIFDHNEAALASLLAEWQRTDETYTQRINNLRNGGGLNGANKLVFGSTVLNDLAADVLTGGLGLDWFLKDNLDTITDLAASEIVN